MTDSIHIAREGAERLLRTMESYARGLSEYIEALDEARDALSPGTCAAAATSVIVTHAERAEQRLRLDIGGVREALLIWAVPDMPEIDFDSVTVTYAEPEIRYPDQRNPRR